MVTSIEVTAVDQKEMGSRVDGDPFPGLMPRRELPSYHLPYGSWGGTLVNLMEPEKSLDASPHFIKAEISFELGKTVTWVTRHWPGRALRLQVGKHGCQAVQGWSCLTSPHVHGSQCHVSWPRLHCDRGSRVWVEAAFGI